MAKYNGTALQSVLDFLHAPTPEAWLACAAKQIPVLLVDHAHCERKAATTALNMIGKYARHKELIDFMSPLAREELLHFEKVMQLIHERDITYAPLKPSWYAQRLHQHVSRDDYLDRLSDELIIGAIIEARSCERFHALVPWLEDKKLAKFYTSLVKAEARHFQDYLYLARLYSRHAIEDRMHYLLDIEQTLIQASDPVFRFHGGVPSSYQDPEKLYTRLCER